MKLFYKGIQPLKKKYYIDKNDIIKKLITGENIMSKIIKV